MPAAVYALASDTLISVVRAKALAMQRADGRKLSDDGSDLLAALGGGALWLLRLLLAGPSTLAEFRAWVIEECPVAPGRKATPALPASNAAPPLALTPPRPRQRRQPGGQPSKRERLISLADQRRDLSSLPLGEVSKLATAVAGEIGYGCSSFAVTCSVRR